MEIIPGLHLINGRAANVYLIIEGGELTLIDTDLPGSHKKIITYIKGLGFQADALKHIIITHADGDHYGSLSALKRVARRMPFALCQKSIARQETGAQFGMLFSFPQLARLPKPAGPRCTPAAGAQLPFH